MRRPHHVGWVVISLLVLAAVGTYAFAAKPRIVPSAVHLINAPQQGMFNIGASTGAVSRKIDTNSGEESIVLTYAAPPGATAGFWVRDFQDIRPQNADRIQLRMLHRAAGPLTPAVIALELKGSKGVQHIPLAQQTEWNAISYAVDWASIGHLNECVLLVSRPGGGNGSLAFDLWLNRTPLLERMSSRPYIRMLAALLLGLLGAGSIALSCRFPIVQKTERRRWPRVHLPVWVKSLKRDFVLGSSVTFVALLGALVYFWGDRKELGAGLSVLAVAAAGGLLGAWMKYGLTGKHLTESEAFRDIAITGILAGSTSSLPILQSPRSWTDLFLLSSVVAAAAMILYHGANLCRLARGDKHLNGVHGWTIAGTPFLVGSLLLLEVLGSGQTGGWAGQMSAFQKTLSAVLLVWGFNEALARILAAGAERNRGLSRRIHACLLASAAAVVTGPWIADLGSSATAASMPHPIRWIIATAAAALSQAALWPEIYLVSGMILDRLQGRAPSAEASWEHAIPGMKKGLVFGGIFMGVLCALEPLLQSEAIRASIRSNPMFAGIILGGLAFPFAKTVIESFDGTQGFLRRLTASYAKPSLLFRGAVVGAGVYTACNWPIFTQPTLMRVTFGAVAGLTVSFGSSLLMDACYALFRCGDIRSWKVYFVHALFGIGVGAALAFYFDAPQVQQILGKIRQYQASGNSPQAFGMYALLSQWGFIQLGTVSGGVKLLYNESLLGVITWGIPAWLFAINGALMAAFFRRDTSQVSLLFTRDGARNLGQNLLQVFRWGLWMSPIIATFLRPMAEPTWYNQDGAVRTLVALFQYMTSDAEHFRTWSLGVFISLLAYSSVRILIWLDHMGLRVATLVNLSFQGMDRFEGRVSRFLGSASTPHCIPEGIKRFATWAPLLIPFYIPRGADWDFAWSRAESLKAHAGGIPGWAAMSPYMALLNIGMAAAAATIFFTAVRICSCRRGPKGCAEFKISNAQYEIVLKQNGEMYGHFLPKGYDVSRRSYDPLSPAGRALFLVDSSREPGSTGRHWAALGNFVRKPDEKYRVEHHGGAIETTGVAHGIRTTIEMQLAGADAAELWTVRLENIGNADRELKLVPYLEWVLNTPGADRGHTQYNRLYPEMEYHRGLNAIFAWHKHSKAMGVLAMDRLPEGFLTSRCDFIGRAQSLAFPRVLETLGFAPAIDTAAHPTFDPIGSLITGVHLAKGESTQIRILVGIAESREEAVALVLRHFPVAAIGLTSEPRRESIRRIRHGEILPETPQPYYEYRENGRKLLVRTPLTPRPYDHTMANARGHATVVTNRGLHTSCSGNSQQNRLTPDWPDTVTQEVPGEAIYLYDIDSSRFYSPTYHPLNDAKAGYRAEFGVDGTATFHMETERLETEMTVFVPVEDTVTLYMLTIRNRESVAKRMRVASYFQMVLSDQPEHAGKLIARCNRSKEVLFFKNPRNEFRKGTAFAAMSVKPDVIEFRRGRFFGSDGDISNPFLVRNAAPDSKATDDFPVAALMSTIEIPAEGQVEVSIVLGQGDDSGQAETVAQRYRDLNTVQRALDGTRRWWLDLMNTVQVQSSEPAMDQYLDWLKYQTLAERIWARRGFYQASGAYGFRDQLQDSVNLIWASPVPARKQILLHAAQQFIEGDTVHWFHILPDGRTGFAARTYASDNLLWLPWAVVEYIELTGDATLLEERAPYLDSDLPLLPLPAGKHGVGFTPLRSSRSDTVYGHCMRAINLAFRRLGAHGLPRMGTGDWNDGLDEIGSKGKGESVWLGFFLYYILQRIIPILAQREGSTRRRFYDEKARRLKAALQSTWRDDRYLRAIHDDGTEIGVCGSGVWEIDALTAAWAVMSRVDPIRARIGFDTALAALERETTILLGWPPLNEKTKPYLGRSSWYPEGVRENGMYCHGVQWLIGAARIIATQCERSGDMSGARRYSETARRLWWKISPLPHLAPDKIEIYGGQPNKQPADLVTALDPGRMGWHGYTGAAGWLFRQALEGVWGLSMDKNQLNEGSGFARVSRDLSGSPLTGD